MLKMPGVQGLAKEGYLAEARLSGASSEELGPRSKGNWKHYSAWEA